MRHFTMVALFVALSTLAYAGDGKTLNTSCESPITKAEVIAAHRKWWPERPDPKSAVLNIRPHWNFSQKSSSRFWRRYFAREGGGTSIPRTGRFLPCNF
jgi:hypothetical protein